MMWENGKLPLSCFETNFALHLSLSLPASLLSTLCLSICSWVRSSTASLRGSVTCMCHCWTGCMSTTPLNTLVASSCVRTTALMKLSSSRCEPSTLPCVKTVGGEAEILKWRGGGRNGSGGKGKMEVKSWQTCPDIEVETLGKCLGWY